MMLRRLFGLLFLFTATVVCAKLPKEFQLGVASAPYHIYGAEGCPASNWAHWEMRGTRPCDGKPTIDGNQRSGNACGFYKNSDKEIAGLLELGATVYRTAIDWSQLFPTVESWNSKTPDLEAVAHYHELFKKLRDNKITLLLTLHHFTHPQWWEEKGGFEKEENIKDIVDFTKYVIEEFGSEIPYIITINEPGPYYVQGYLRGEFPPGKCAHQVPATPAHWSRGLTLAAHVIKNILFAHVQMYDLIKSMNPNIQVSLAHNILHFEPNQWWNPLDVPAAAVFNYEFNTPIYNFLKTGKFAYHIPGYVNVKDNRYQGKKFMDYFGLNFYSRVAVCGAMQTTHKKGEIMTDMEYPMAPEAFRKALREAAALGLPIIITEAGLADVRDDRREFWFREHIRIIEEEIANGLPIIGVTWWSKEDNFEWNNGFDGDGKMKEGDGKKRNPKFGLFAMDRSDTTNIKFTLRKGAYWIRDLMVAQRAEQEALLHPLAPLIAVR